MWWAIGWVVLVLAGIGVLALLVRRLWHQVRALGRDMAAAAAQLERLAEGLDRLAETNDASDAAQRNRTWRGSA